MTEDRPAGEQAPQFPNVPTPDTPRCINSADILCGDREIFIQHGEERYRLRVTKAGKLILNK